MNQQIVSIARLDDGQVVKLAELHQRTMHSLLTDLGLPLIKRYYQIARADSSVIGLCAVDADGSLLGWAIGSSKPEQVTRQMSEAQGWFIVQMTRVLFTNPKSIWQIFLSMRSSPMAMKPGAIELTYIGVDESARKRGLGRELLKAFIHLAREKKFRSIELSVEAENTAAIALYTRAGFTILASFKEGKFDRHRMELILT